MRQGHPLALLLFTVLTDFLIQQVKKGDLLQGLQDLEGEEENLSIFADDNYLMLLASAKNVGRVLEIMKEFRTLSGCCVNWGKSKIISLNINETPQYAIMIPRVRGEDFMSHLGIPLMEGEENSELGRQVCAKFIRKAQALNVLELSVPAKLVAISYILTATLWYYIFVWAPSEAKFKKLQTLILNFLWGRTWITKTTIKRLTGIIYPAQIRRWAGSCGPQAESGCSSRAAAAEVFDGVVLPLERIY